MTRRSRAREVALQLLFQFDLNPNVARDVLDKFVHERLRESDLASYCLALYDSVQINREVIDSRIVEAAENWRLPRMAAVDRNILRLGTCELLYGNVPATAAINEAIELARRFGSKDSSAFVNGILDRIANPHLPESAAPPNPVTTAPSEASTPNPESP